MDLTWCFYAAEEVAQEFNGLRQLWDERPDLLAADAAILGEPTGGLVEAGCQGTLRVRVRLAGARAHTARPYTGRNAIHRLAPLLTAVAGYEGRRPVIDGCEYAEQLQVVSVEGGRGRQRGARRGRRGGQPPVRARPHGSGGRVGRCGNCWPLPRAR